MRSVGGDQPLELEELRRRMAVRGNRRTERELTEVLQQVVQLDRAPIRTAPVPITRGEALDRERRQAEQVVAAVERHVDGEIVAGVDTKVGPIPIAKVEPR